jgi:hypothetical protein
MTLPGTRTHDESAFTPKCSQGSPSPQRPRDRPTSARRHQERLTASLPRWHKRHPDPGDPTQRPAGHEGTGTSRSSPPATGRAKSVPDTAVINGVQQGTTGTPIVTSQRRPPTCHRRPGAISPAWRVKDSNLGRHQPTDLQPEHPCVPDLDNHACCVCCRHISGAEVTWCKKGSL